MSQWYPQWEKERNHMQIHNTLDMHLLLEWCKPLDLQYPLSNCDIFIERNNSTWLNLGYWPYSFNLIGSSCSALGDAICLLFFFYLSLHLNFTPNLRKYFACAQPYLPQIHNKKKRSVPATLPHNQHTSAQSPTGNNIFIPFVYYPITYRILNRSPIHWNTL